MPDFVKNILNGTKKFEYRKSIPKNNFDTILIYSTYPDMKVVALVEVKNIIKLPVEKLWQKTKKYSGISKIFFKKYFKNRKIGYAYELGKIIKIRDKKITDFGVKHPPQNFIYMSINSIREMGINI